MMVLSTLQPILFLVGSEPPESIRCFLSLLDTGQDNLKDFHLSRSGQFMADDRLLEEKYMFVSEIILLCPCSHNPWRRCRFAI